MSQIPYLINGSTKAILTEQYCEPPRDQIVIIFYRLLQIEGVQLYMHFFQISHQLLLFAIYTYYKIVHTHQPSNFQLYIPLVWHDFSHILSEISYIYKKNNFKLMNICTNVIINLSGMQTKYLSKGYIYRNCTGPPKRASLTK